MRSIGTLSETGWSTANWAKKIPFDGTRSTGIIIKILRRYCS